MAWSSSALHSGPSFGTVTSSTGVFVSVPMKEPGGLDPLLGGVGKA
jgi:hypothetical protein